MKAAGAERMFAEQVSSVAQRAKLTECLTFLRDGDVLAATKPYRLARSTAELLTIEWCAAIKVRTRDNQGEKASCRVRWKEGGARPEAHATGYLA